MVMKNPLITATGQAVLPRLGQSARIALLTPVDSTTQTQTVRTMTIHAIAHAQTHPRASLRLDFSVAIALCYFHSKSLPKDAWTSE
jgi:hypothetical protein